MTGENENDQLLLEHKANIFLKTKDTTHIKFKKGYWKRGIITEVSSDFFMLEERMEGLQPIFFLEVESIDKFIPKERKDNVNT